jgi:Secretion system C-terminal sorting domain
MKISLTISVLFCSLQFFCQEEWQIDFESPNSETHRIWIDTISNPNNAWQIGPPQKSGFGAAASSPNVIITDTINSVPPNDTSIFYLYHIKQSPGNIFHFGFKYFMDGDSTDFGKIELYNSQVGYWIDTVEEDEDNDFYYFLPQLSGSTNGWVNQPIFLNTYEDEWPLEEGDTMLFRFTYITDNDSIGDNGWMLDNFYFKDYTSDVTELSNNDLFVIYPNPASHKIQFQTSQLSHDQSITIQNTLGETVLFIPEFEESSIDVSNFPGGMYYLKLQQGDEWAIKKFLVDR